MASNTNPPLPLLQLGILIALLLPAKRLVALGEWFGNPALVLFLYALVLAATVCWLFYSTKSQAPDLFGDFHYRHILSGLLWGIGLFLVVGMGYAINQTVFGLKLPSEAGLFSSTGISVLWIVGIILIGPILEEYIFRGLFLQFLMQKIHAFFAIALSAALFSAYHLSTFQLLPIFLLGLGLGFIAWRSKSLWPGTIAHLVFNSLGFTLFILFPQ